MQLAILHLRSDSGGEADICAVYNPYYASIPSTLEETVSFFLKYVLPN